MQSNRSFYRKGRVRATAVVAFAWGVLGLEMPASAAVAQTAIHGQASASGFPAGSVIFDSATIGNARNPTGTLTFKVFEPGDTSCSGTVLFTSTIPVTAAGYYQSASFTTNRAGTYGWVATYSGDANNAPAATKCNESSQLVMVGKRTPTLNTAASTVSARGQITDIATLAMGQGVAGPTGTITFKLYGPNNMVCGGEPIFTSVKAVKGNGQYASDVFTPTRPGTYRWVSHYSGDANNNGAQTICADPVQAVEVASRVPAFINRAYKDLLGRSPSLVESTLATPLLELGSDRSTFALSLVTTPEFRKRTIEGAYQHLGRSVDSPALNAFHVLLADGWPLEIVPAIVLGSDEFYARHGSTPAAFVDALYAAVLQSRPDPTAKAKWINDLDGGLSRTHVAWALLNSRIAHTNVVETAYPWLLRRDADSFARTYWTDHLDAGLRQDHLYAFFVGSLEYWLNL